jgi:hypothetical protein
VVLPRYPLNAANLWRWVEAPDEDLAIAAFLDDGGQRSRLSARDQDALIVYAQRCALAAVRSRDGAPVVKAFEALARVSMDTVDEDRLLQVATLVAYAASHLSDRQRASVVPALMRAEEDVADVLSGQVDLLDDAGYHELDTPAGRVILEDESGLYEPEADLIATAYAVAEMLEADGYGVDSVGIGQTLRAIWVRKVVSEEALAATDRVTGCVHVHAFKDLGYVGVYVAEASTSADAETIGTAAERVDSPPYQMLGVWAGRLCAIVYAGSLDPSKPGPADKSTLDHLRAPLRAILAG